MEYTITNVQPRGEWSSDYGQMIDYAVSLEGQDGWHKLTQKVDTKPPQEGDKLNGVIENKKDKNGNAYKKFKKVNPNYEGNRSSRPSDGKIDYIIQMLEELTGRRDQVAEVTDEDTKSLLDNDPFEGI